MWEWGGHKIRGLKNAVLIEIWKENRREQSVTRRCAEDVRPFVSPTRSKRSRTHVEEHVTWSRAKRESQKELAVFLQAQQCKKRRVPSLKGNKNVFLFPSFLKIIIFFPSSESYLFNPGIRGGGVMVHEGTEWCLNVSLIGGDGLRRERKLLGKASKKNSEEYENK